MDRRSRSTALHLRMAIGKRKCPGLRLTRVRDVPLASKALSFGDLITTYFAVKLRLQRSK